MAKVTYEFDYYEDRDLIARHAAVGDAFAFIDNLNQDLRSLLKYGKGGGGGPWGKGALIKIMSKSGRKL